MEYYIVLENSAGCELTRYPSPTEESLSTTLAKLAEESTLCPGDIIRIIEQN